MLSCPRCGSHDVRHARTTIPLGRGRSETRHQFYCNACRLLEDGAGDEAHFGALVERWGLAPPQPT